MAFGPTVQGPNVGPCLPSHPSHSTHLEPSSRRPIFQGAKGGASGMQEGVALPGASGPLGPIGPCPWARAWL